MKALILICCIFVSGQLSAQEIEPNENFKNTFVRVFDVNGKKFAKGEIAYVGENSLKIKHRGNTTEIPLEKIRRIKTKHSAATNVLVGAAIGATLGAIIGSATTESDDWLFTKSEAGLLGAIAGGGTGAGIGGITLLFRKSNVYHIQGNKANWEYFRDSMRE